MIYSIGYAGKTIRTLIEHLQQHGIKVLADVRSVPGSRAFPDYNQRPLAEGLNASGIAYRWLPELGPRSRNPDHYDASGQVQFDRLRKDDAFRQGLDAIGKYSADGKVACMCAEKLPETCHRSLLIGEALHGMFVPMTHILFNGSLETHHEMLARLAAGFGGLFPDEDQAMQIFTTRHAYVSPEPLSQPTL